MPRSLHYVPSAGGTRYVFDAQGSLQVAHDDTPAANHDGGYGGYDNAPEYDKADDAMEITHNTSI